MAPAIEVARAPRGDASAALMDAFGRFRREVMTADQRAKLAELERSHTRPRRMAAAFRFARDHRLLPEAYLYGHAHVLHGAGKRPAFLNGEVRLGGWRSFFPYTFLVKTPVATLAVIALALALPACLAKRGGCWAHLYETAPLWAFLAVYWASAIASDLNIGHRHILPVYPPLFVLAGATARALDSRHMRLSRLASAPLVLSLVLLTVESLLVWPSYLAYFNQIVGMRNGWKHLVDSSLDWGQDLPSLKRFVDARLAEDPARRIYLSYFGTASPDHLGIAATLLPGMCRDYERRRAVVRAPLGPSRAPEAVAALLEKHPGFFLLDTREGGAPDGAAEAILVKSPASLRLTAGLYCVSATMLQPLLYKYHFGPWCERYERIYQSLLDVTRQIQESDDAEALRALLLTRGMGPSAEGFFERFEDIRFARLAAHLRERAPTTSVNYSILVHDLTAQDIERFLLGPPPRMGPDILEQIRR